MAYPRANPYLLDEDDEIERRDRYAALSDAAAGQTEDVAEIEAAEAALQHEYPEGNPGASGGPAATPEQFAAAREAYARDFPDETARLRAARPGLFDQPQGSPQGAASAVPPQSAAQPLAQPAAQPVLERTQDTSPWGALANFRQQRARGAAQMEPPPVRGQDKTWMGVAAAADRLLNRGRSLGQLGAMAAQPDRSAMQAYKLQQDAERHDVEMAQRLAHADGRSNDPESLALRRDALAQRRAEFEQRVKGADAKHARDAALSSLDSIETRAQQDAAVMVGMPEEQARKMTGAQILQWRPQIGQVAHSLESNEEWRKRFGMTQTAAVAKEGRESEREFGKEERTAERATGTRAEEFAESYATKYDKDLAIAGLIQDIDAAGGSAPQSFAERFKGPLAARGVAPERLEAWRAKQLVVEEFMRKQTGAAISLSEEDRGDMIAGLAPTASEADATAAFNVMRRHIRRYMRMGAVANPGAARSVTRAAELDDSWLEGIGDANPERGKKRGKPGAKAAAAPKSAGGDPADGIEWD